MHLWALSSFKTFTTACKTASDLLSSLWVSTFWIDRVKGATQDMMLRVLPLSPSRTFLTFTNVTSSVLHFFLQVNNIAMNVCAHSFISGYLSFPPLVHYQWCCCSHHCVQLSLWTWFFFFFHWGRHTWMKLFPRMTLFSTIWGAGKLFRSGCTRWHYQQPWARVAVALRVLQQFLVCLCW